MLNLDSKIKYKNLLYVVPFVLLVTVFTFYPLIRTLVISFNGNYNKFSDSLSISVFNWNNYKSIFGDPFFILSFFNTVFLMIVVVPISILISLIISICLNHVYNKFFKNILETCLFLPFLMNKVIMGIVFSIIFYHSYGFFNNYDGFANNLLSFFGSEPHSWVSDSAPWGRKMFVLVFYIVWTNLPLKIFIFSLGLKSINKSYYNTARIDGASRLRIFFQITIPLLSNIIFYQFVMSVLQIFKEYDAIIGIFGNISSNSNIQTITFYIYKQLQSDLLDSYAKGAAASIILSVISLIVISIIFYFIKNKTIRKINT